MRLSEKCQASPLQHSFWVWYAFVKRQLLLSRKAMTILELQTKEVCVLKSKDITLLTNVCIVKAMVFSVEMYQCVSWTIKKAEHWRTGAFELWCWRRLLRVPWKARTSNQSILKEMNSEYSLEGLILKLKLQYFVHLMLRPLWWERLKVKREEGDRGWDDWVAPPTQWTWIWANSGRWCGTKSCSQWGHKKSDTTWWLNNNSY